MDPYRGHVDEGPKSVVVAHGSRLGDGLRAAVAFLVAAALSGAALYFPLDKLGWALHGLAAFVALDGVRHLASLRLPRRIEANAQALRVVMPQPVQGRPWMRRSDRRIPWSDVVEIRTKHDAGTSALCIELRGEMVTIEAGMLAGGVGAAQTKLLDLYDAWFRQPVRESAGVAAYNRRRFASPVRIGLARGREILAGLFLVALFGGLATMLGVMSGTWGPIRWVFIAPPAGFALGLGALFLSPPRVRAIELTAEGFAYGRPGALRLVPWQDVRFARPHVIRQVGSPARTVAITVGFADGGAVTLHDVYDKPLPELAALIEPPLSVVAAAVATSTTDEVNPPAAPTA